MKRTKLLIIVMLLAALTFGAAVSGMGSEDINQTASYGEFDPGNMDQMILNGGTMAQDGEVTYYTDEEGLHRTSGENDKLVSDDIAENINVSDNILYYTVTEGDASQIKVLDLGSLKESEILTLDGGIGQMYFVNSEYICYSSEGTVYQLDLETGETEQIETAGEVFSFLPSEYGIVYGVGELFDIDIYAGDTLVSKSATSFYTDEGYILLETDGQQYQVGLEDAFNGSGGLEEVNIYETVDISDILCEDENCEVCEANYEALLNGEISLNSYQVQEDADEGNIKILSDGQTNVVLRARQQAEIQWTPLTTVSGWRGQYTFEAGTTYYGIPYGQPVNQGYYTPYTATFSTFASSVRDSSSKFYTSYSSYGSKTSTYYASDCSAFVSWAWDIPRTTTSNLNGKGTVISNWTTYSFRVGDALNLSNSHCVLISNVEYNSSGAVSAVEIMEQTPPICKTTRFGEGGTQTLASLTSRYSGYALVRYNKIDSVVYTYDANVPLDGTKGTFVDVASNKWFYEAVEYVYANGLFNGTSSNTFSPEASMTRGQLVTVLGRMSGIDEAAYSYTGTIKGTNVRFRSTASDAVTSNIIGAFNNGDPVTIIGSSGSWYQVIYNGTTGYVAMQYVTVNQGTFSDVPAGKYYTGYIEWAVEAGIVEGYNSTKFAPDDSLTREQMCTILCRYASYCEVTLSQAVEEIAFVDASSISNYAREHVKTLQMAGIIEGVGDGKFAPQDTCTRAQVAALLMRYHKNYV